MCFFLEFLASLFFHFTNRILAFTVVNDNPGSMQNHAFFFLWIAFAIISSCYTLTWDLKMDWGLLDSNAGENRFLREEIVYAYKVRPYFLLATCI